MAETDFIDEDLLQRPETQKESKPAPQPATSTAGAPESDLSLPHLTRRKEEFNSQVATKMDELERLRLRQEALEREKNLFEFLRKSQEKYEVGKRELLENLQQNLLSLEREEVLLSRRIELLIDTEKRFKEMQGELRNIQEETWPSDAEGHREALTRALVLQDNMRKEFNKSLARIEAIRSDVPAPGENKPLFFNEASGGLERMGFWFWAKLGLAASLPLVIAFILLAAALAVWMFNYAFR